MMNGWIKICRELPNHWIWKDANRLKWWLDLLLMASWEDRKELSGGSRLIEVKRGQLSAAIPFLAQRWGVSEPTVRKFIVMLEKEKMIERTVYPKECILTICNFDKYQAMADDMVYPSDNLSLYPKDNPTVDPILRNKEIKKIINKKTNKNSSDDFSELEEAFEVFRKRYPGTKRGHKIELENLKKKYPSTWQSIIPLLLPAIEREIKHHEDAAAVGVFVPAYAHLATWINQARWTSEFPSIASNQQPQSVQPIHPIQTMIDYSDDDFGGADY